ncbi:MAG: DHA2 family efflux MFS transporter permease subunit [Burkholderiales bacterium]|nr:DHA2 family efflux MFS transporter permease subunit [Burkholderiales bacterium]
MLGTFALSLATFMNVLDTSIANVSLPAIAGDLGVSPAQGTWVITSFAVANAIAVPLTGWLTRRIGPVRLFTGSVGLFVIASWLCGLASSFEMLIAFRVLQGLVAGPMNPLSQTLLLTSYPRAKAGTALAMWGVVVLVAPVVGPLLGGWITDNISWPWIFFINVPVGMLAMALTWSVYRHRDDPPQRLPLDRIGLVLLVLFVGALQIMLDKGRELDWLESNLIVVLAIVAVVGFVVFLTWELTAEHPIVDLRLFGQRNFAAGTLAMAVAFGQYFGIVVLLPLWLQEYMGYTPTWAGIAIAPVGLLAIVLAPWVGRRVAHTDARLLASVAFVAFAFVMWFRSRFDTNIDVGPVIEASFLQGIGTAFFFIPLQAIIFSGLGQDRLASAAGLSNFARLTAGAVGTSIYTTQWDNLAAMHHAHLAETVNPGNLAAVQTLGQLQAAGLSQPQALELVNRLVDQQAYTMAATDLFYVSALMFIVLIGFIWLARPQGLHAGGGGVGGDAH